MRRSYDELQAGAVLACCEVCSISRYFTVGRPPYICTSCVRWAAGILLNQKKTETRVDGRQPQARGTWGSTAASSEAIR